MNDSDSDRRRMVCVESVGCAKQVTVSVPKPETRDSRSYAHYSLIRALVHLFNRTIVPR